MNQVTVGQGGLPKVALTSLDGAHAEIYLHGAHVTSWRPAGDTERLYLSPHALFRPGAAIRGGVPIIFPQFAGFGPLPKHGFARSMAWTFAGAEQGDSATTARFTLAADAFTRNIWPHNFAAELMVTVGGSQLAIALSVLNQDDKPFGFTAALHTYLAVDDLSAAAVVGLTGTRYVDSTAGGGAAVDAAPTVMFAGEVDRIYFDAAAGLRLEMGSPRATLVRSIGFPDAVVWNPGPLKGAALDDLGPDGYRQFVCIEAAAIGRPVELAAGERWQGVQVLEGASGW